MVDTRPGWYDPRSDVEQLAKFTLEAERRGGAKYISPHEALQGAVATVTWPPEDRAGLVGLPGADQFSAEDAAAALRLIPYERTDLDYAERDLIEAALDRGMSWEQLGEATGGRSRQAMQQRYRRLGGKRTWPTRRPAPVAVEGTDA